MNKWPVHATWNGPIVMIGFGSIGRGTLPLILRHIACDRANFTVIDPRRRGATWPKSRALPSSSRRSPRQNYKSMLTPLLTAGPGQALLRQPLGRCRLRRYHASWPRDRRALHRHGRSSRGRASTTTRSSAMRTAPTTRCAKTCWRCGESWARPHRAFPAAAPIPAWCPGSSSRRCSTSPATLKLQGQRARRRARAGPS